VLANAMTGPKREWYESLWVLTSFGYAVCKPVGIELPYILSPKPWVMVDMEQWNFYTQTLGHKIVT
jgi:hypothetical protein